jgi:hypothetical protein
MSALAVATGRDQPCPYSLIFVVQFCLTL